MLVAGVDEPGFAVSAIDDEGYLRLTALVDAQSADRLAQHFLGQPVRVATGSGTLIPGVVAAPSVHFASLPSNRGRSALRSSRDLFVDIGASSDSEAKDAGVRVLDRVTLEKAVVRLPPDRVSAPWIASRAGAAILLELAQRIHAEGASIPVAIAFITQQHPYNAGIARILRSVDAERVVLLAPTGGTVAAVAPARGAAHGLVDELVGLARDLGLFLERRPARGLGLGPFGNSDVWNANQKAVTLMPTVRNAATPAEAINESEITALAGLLATLVGLRPPQPGQVSKRTEEGTSPQSSGTGPSRPGFAGSLEGYARQLVAIPGVSGQENAIREALVGLLPSDLAAATKQDEAGNLIVRVGTGAVVAAFIAHMDEIGLEVRSVGSKGTASAVSRGGGDPDYFDWQAVHVHGPDASVPAIMTRHGTLDVGYPPHAAIRAGSTVTVPKRFRKLLGTRVSARSLDDRLGCAVLVEAIHRLTRRARRATNAVDFVFSVEEETGLRGSRRLAANGSPPRVYAIDTFVTSDSPLESRHIAYAPLGAGPVLRALDESGSTPRNEIARIMALAARHRIPLQLGATAGGNDGSVFSSLDSASIPIGFPLRYAHTPVETADMRDAEAAADLIELLALEELRGN